MSGLMVAGTAQVVIRIPKQAVMKALPTIAGLKVFEPRPPKTILPIAIAKALPIIAAHQGRCGGTDRARIIPVTTALKSSTLFGFFLIRLQSHSVRTEAMMQTVIRISARVRK